MNQFSIDILLEFLYNKFATTFMFCIFGSFVREYLTNIKDSNNKKYGNFNPGKVVISAIFSTILMCACADYVNVDLHIEVYAIISVVLGMWGLSLMICLKKLFTIFLSNIAFIILNPHIPNTTLIIAYTSI